MVAIKGTLKTVTASPSTAVEVWITAEEVRTRAGGTVVLPEKSRVLVGDNGDFTTNIEPGAALLIVAHNGYRGETIPLLVTDSHTTIDQCINAARLADGTEQTELEQLIDRISKSQRILSDGVADAKQAARDAQASATAADQSKTDAADSSAQAKASATAADQSKTDAANSAAMAESSEYAAFENARSARGSKDAAADSAAKAKGSEDAAANSAAKAKGSEDAAAASAADAKKYAENTKVSAGEKAPLKHTHKAADITDLDEKLNTKADKSHTHTSNDITDAQADGRNAASGKLVKWDSSGRIKTPGPIENENPVTLWYLNDKLATKADTSHTHDGADITNTTGYMGRVDRAGRVVAIANDGFVHSDEDPTDDTHLVRKSYVDDNLATKVDKSQVAEAVTKQGDIVARSAGGNISVPLRPDNDNAAASRRYVTEMSDNLFTDPKFRDDCWGGWTNNNYGGCLTILANGTQTGLYYEPIGYRDRSLVLEPGEKYVVRAKVLFGGDENIGAFSLHLSGTKGYISLPCEFKRNKDTSNRVGWLTETFIAPEKLKETNGECAPGFYVESKYKRGFVSIIEVHITKCVEEHELGIDTTRLIGAPKFANMLVKTDAIGKVFVDTTTIENWCDVVNKEYADSLYLELVARIEKLEKK